MISLNTYQYDTSRSQYLTPFFSSILIACINWVNSKFLLTLAVSPHLPLFFFFFHFFTPASLFLAVFLIFSIFFLLFLLRSTWRCVFILLTVFGSKKDVSPAPWPIRYERTRTVPRSVLASVSRKNVLHGGKPLLWMALNSCKGLPSSQHVGLVIAFPLLMELRETDKQS